MFNVSIVEQPTGREEMPDDRLMSLKPSLPPPPPPSPPLLPAPPSSSSPNYRSTGAISFVTTYTPHTDTYTNTHTLTQPTSHLNQPINPTQPNQPTNQPNQSVI
ncbi:hypothetical protein LOAG_10312 [Loa loa]|uniref:Uncharacterized protein n=1 Tax=Loa loa TaxID=7209 RepID=A0A1I7VRY8_LOALO|nr:hypothetical protein LOAG_10312 [Loa loa]EFO18184.1 hypothetical protein LOAG_10312 [Loa loa]